MPRRSNRSESQDSEENNSSRKKSLRDTKAVAYSEGNGDGDDNGEAMDVTDENIDHTNDDDDNGDEDDDVTMKVEDEEETSGGRRRSSRARSNSNSVAVAVAKKEHNTKMSGRGEERRTSSRATKFKSSMKEPSGESIRDLLKHTNSDSGSGSHGTNKKEKGTMSTIKRAATPRSQRKPTEAAEPSSPQKSPVRRRRHARLTIAHTTADSDSESDASDNDDLREEDSEEDDDDEEEPFKIQKIIAARTEARNVWAQVGATMNTSEIDHGSRWVQTEIKDDDDTFEERFLVKWSDISHLHVSWETESDLLELADNAKNYLSTFFRKSNHGLLFSSDERCDGDYFDPAWTQIDRILDFHFPDECPCKSVKDEDKITNVELGICLDKKDQAYEDGLGREFLVKWGNSTYAESTFEFERDLILNEVEYKDQLKGFHSRRTKPTKDQAKKLHTQGEVEFRRLYKTVFGDKSDDKDEDEVENYQKELGKHVFKSGGQLRDYQTEGVSWMLANFINKRSAILADEMGLGKTITTAVFLNLVATKLNRRGPFLVIAPLSTLGHWQREFEGWTMLNTIVYHGSAKDRKLIRQLEFAYDQDRPANTTANEHYLRKCSKKHTSGAGNPWQFSVIITTPELLCADDFHELTAIKWECLVVDEAHRLKNYSSKFAVNLRDSKFTFGHKMLLTGTPIQNTMEELHALLSFVDPALFDDVDAFMEKYGEMKSKERVDELHEEIRPFILRRLKEDVEKSVPPKEETVIEVELTVAQKQYYRALYEKNVKFLNKNKKRALDGPSLNNLAMQLRKCCNHLFLLNGIEEEFRQKQITEGKHLSEGDLLVAASGKLVLLDKLLPRLKDTGHRVLIFSQFKIMLDVLEDYLQHRRVNFERIDGSITGNKRQQAIDRFQSPSADGKEQPFIMLLSTRAGGVGINLTAADTCIIFDSDWNPQNDLQAQARCHRIGQTKSVKVYRLLTAKTYEMQMFHMSSLKMGLDQAVLSGFEAGTSGDGALSKDEVEKLLRHGAYGIFSEDKDGNDAESNDFVQQDIDTILDRRSRTVVHDNTGSQSNAAGGTFSKARFTAPKSAGEKKAPAEDVDIEDPDFWTKMVGEAKEEEGDDDFAGQRRKRKVMNYAEGTYEKSVDASLIESEADDDEEDESCDESYASDDEAHERIRWGGSKMTEWKKEEAKKLLHLLHAHGYGNVSWERMVEELATKNSHDKTEIQRMCWSMLLLALCEIAEEDAAQTNKRAVRAAEKKRETADSLNSSNGGVLAEREPQAATAEAKQVLVQRCFTKLWLVNACWAAPAFDDARAFARSAEPRTQEILSRGLMRSSGVISTNSLKPDEISLLFVQNVWPSLKSRGWKATVLTEGPNAGKAQYMYESKKYYSPEAVLAVVTSIHSELANLVESIQSVAESSCQKSIESEAKLKEKHLAMTAGNIEVAVLQEFLRKYAPLQLICDRSSEKRLHIKRNIVHAATYLYTTSSLIQYAESTRDDKPLIDHLSSLISVDKRMSIPHPLWSIRHDSILIHAIGKHGWTDNETSFRRMTKDATVKWGFPFDLDHSAASVLGESNSKKPSKRDILIANLSSVSLRAAELFNMHDDTLEEVKGFNKNLVIRTYCLVYLHQDDSDANVDCMVEEEETKSPRSKWVVDTTQLLESIGLNSTASKEFVELPHKKDLVKRAKLILTKNVDLVALKSECPAQNEAAKSNIDTPNTYYVLDQSDRCNVLLAEILKATVKAPYPKAQNAIRMLCAVASKEAMKRHESMRDSIEGEATDQSESKSQEMAETAKNIDTARRFLQQSKVGSFNILRSLLGLEIVNNPRGSNFPGSIEDMDGLENQESLLTGKAKAKREDSAIGDRALARAMGKCFDRNDGGPGRVLPEGHSTDLELTAIETLIVSVVCSQGLPIWTENLLAQLSVVEDEEASKEESAPGNNNLSWDGLGNVLAAAAKEWHESAKRRSEACSNDFRHYDDQGETQPKMRARKNLANAIKTLEAKELAASQAADYSGDPSILAKKTVMLIERLRRKMGNSSGGHTKTTKKVNYWLGPKVFDFLSAQLTKWANSLDIVDAKRRTLSYTAADFYHDLPIEERERVEVTAHLNKQDCRQLLIQITLLSRLRSIFSKYAMAELLPRIEIASENCKVGDAWGAQPGWWATVGDSPSRNDALLLQSLVEFGFGGVLSHAKCFSSIGEEDGHSSLKELGMTKASVQQRSNQLVRELHNMERSQFIISGIEERQQKLVEADKQDARMNGNSKTQEQKRLHSFFSQADSNSKSRSSQLVTSWSKPEDDFGIPVSEGIESEPTGSLVNDIVADEGDGNSSHQQTCAGATALAGSKRSDISSLSHRPALEKKARLN